MCALFVCFFCFFTSIIFISTIDVEIDSVEIDISIWLPCGVFQGKEDYLVIELSVVFTVYSIRLLCRCFTRKGRTLDVNISMFARLSVVKIGFLETVMFGCGPPENNQKTELKAEGCPQ